MDSSLKILVVEDHHVLRTAMVNSLASAGFDASGVMSAEEFDQKLPKVNADIYVLDLNLPGEDGLSLSMRLREGQPNCGIIMLTARNLKQDRIQGYKSGADVYLMKPTDLDELLAAVDSLAERLNRQLPEARVGKSSEVRLHCGRRELVGPSGKESLSQREVLVLAALAKTLGQPLSYLEIIELCGEDASTYQKSSLEVAMTRLRQKLERVGCASGSLVAVRGSGYLLNFGLAVD